MAFVAKRIRLIVPANKAKPSPSIGQALGAVGINMMKFCKEFNAKSAPFVDDLPMRAVLSIRNDGSHEITMRSPKATYYLLKCANLDVASGEAKHKVVGRIHVKQLYELAKIKREDNNKTKAASLKTIFGTLIAQCRGMGLEVDFNRQPYFDGIKRQRDADSAKRAADAAALAAAVAASRSGKKK